MSKELNTPQKILLWINFSLKNPIEIGFKNKECFVYKDPIFNLLTDNTELETVLREKILTEFLYFNREKIDSLLYEEENSIEINSESKNTKSLSYIFYLNLLISDKLYCLNYTYKLEYINDIIKIYLDEPNQLNNITRLIASKSLLDIIMNYETEEEELKDNLNSKCTNYIQNNKTILKSLGLSEDDLISKKIDEIYVKILNKLVINNFFYDYDSAEILLEQLDLLNIKITNTMFNELLKILNEDNDNIKKFKINKIEDLKDKHKKNFYYIILKYILKNPFYNYNIPFLYKMRIILLNSIKSNGYHLPFEKDEKIIFLLTSILDSNYYSKKLNLTDETKINFFNQNSDFSNNTIISKDSHNISGRSYILNEEMDRIVGNFNDNISIYNEIIDNGRKFNIFNCFFNIKIIKIRNKFSYKYEKITYKIDSKKFNDIKYEDFIKFAEREIYYNSDIKFIKFVEYLNYIKSELINSLRDSINFNFNLEINFEQSSSKINDDINCIYKLLDINSDEKSEFKDYNILSNEFEQNIGFKYLNNYILNLVLKLPYDKSIEYSIIEFDKILGELQDGSEFIRELKNGAYISGSNESLFYFDKNKIINIELNNDSFFYINSSCEISSNSGNENDINAFICSKDYLYLIIMNTNNYKYNLKSINIDENKCKMCIEANKDNYILVGAKGIFNLCGSTSNIFKDEANESPNLIPLINGEYFINGIKINEKIFAFSSKREKEIGEDKLIIYNLSQKKIISEIKNYSFSDSINGLTIMDIYTPESINKKVLLCACKKYDENGGKNGILLVELINDKEKIYYEFYETKFEVNCFCQISKENDSKVFNIKTSYFLSGEFDAEKGIGVIYLYELIYDKKMAHTKIEQLIEVGYQSHKIFDYFSCISCIIQCKETGKILIACLDGNIYSFLINGNSLLYLD